MRVGAVTALVLALGLSMVAPPRASAAVDATVPVPSGATVPDNRVRVLLPAGYDADACRRYPVLYLLHGVGDTWLDWSRRSDLVAFAGAFPVIVVMPDGGKGLEAGWYSDWADGSRQWERFHIDGVVPWVDATYRTLGDGHRMIAGFSMGGFGAMSYAARHPGLFKAAASFSGILDTMFAFPASGPLFGTLHDRFGTPDDRVWGNQLTHQAEWRAHNPTNLAEKLRGTSLFVYTGTGLPLGSVGDNPQQAQQYAVEHFVFQTNLSFLRSLDAAGVSYRSDVHAGYHDWPYFQAGLHWALPQMMPLVDLPATPCQASAPASLGGTPSIAAGRETLPATGDTTNPLLALTLLVAVAGVARARRRMASVTRNEPIS